MTPVNPCIVASSFRTLQDRLPKELALAGIVDVAAANAFIRKVYLPAHNARFATAPAAASAFAPVAEAQWRDILCVPEERVVAPDNTVAWNGERLPILPHPARARFVRAKVRAHRYVDGEIAIFHGPRPLAREPERGEKRRRMPAGRLSPFWRSPQLWTASTRLTPRPPRRQRNKNRKADT